MLWQKHMVKGKDVYVDLLKKNEMRTLTQEFSQKLKTFEEQCVYLGKNDAFSQEVRMKGNDMFTNGDYERALDYYNRSVTLAGINSENLGICYGNRSACFFELKQYSLCLVDIELAKENNYPMRLMAKLDKRKAECLKFIENQKDLTELCHETPKLSFEPHLEFPCFASEIDVNSSNTGESNITTNVDLEIGQTIIIERTMVFTPSGGNEMGYCHYCFKRNVNLIPCQTYIIAMFCSNSPHCHNASNSYHQIVCGVEHFFNTSVLYELLRTIIFAINIFPKIENLMSAIENFRNSSGRRKLDNNYSDPAKRQYLQFFGLRSIVHLMTDEEKIQIKKYAVEVAMFIKHASKLRAIFQSTKMFQFLLHLSLHHMEIICSNGYSAFQYYSGSPFERTLGIKDGKPQMHFGSGIAPYTSQLKHSCVPNVCRIYIDDTIVYRVIRSIKRGEQLCVSYLDPLQLLLPTAAREKPLSNRYHLKCDCVSCTSNYPPFKATGNNELDTLTQSLLELLEGAPNEYLNKLLVVSPTELRQFENAAINFLRNNEQVHPTEETLKMENLLIQIRNLIMR